MSEKTEPFGMVSGNTPTLPAAYVVTNSLRQPTRFFSVCRRLCATGFIEKGAVVIQFERATPNSARDRFVI